MGLPIRRIRRRRRILSGARLGGCEQLCDLPIEGRNIFRITTREEIVIHNRLLVDPAAPPPHSGCQF
jgi:hypothetical protein